MANAKYSIGYMCILFCILPTIVLSNHDDVFFFADCADLEISTQEDDCQGLLEFVWTPEINCITETQDFNFSYEIKNTNGETVAAEKSASVNKLLDVGIYNIEWRMQDNCGQNYTCTQKISVLDKQEPAINCKSDYQRYLIMREGMTEPQLSILPTDLIKSVSDNCASLQELTFSFASDHSEPVKEFRCGDFGVHEIEIFVSDLDGNMSSCIVSMTVADYHAACPSPSISDQTSTIDCGQSEVCFSIEHQDISNLSAFQTSLEWDTDLMTYQNVNSGILDFSYHPSRIIEHNVSTGNIILNWFSPDGISIEMDHRALFDICFTINGEHNDEIKLRFSEDSFYTTALVSGDSQLLNVCKTDGGINLAQVSNQCQDGVQGEIAINKYSRSCESREAEDDESSMSMNCGLEKICVPIYAKNVDKLLLMQTSFKWDNTLIDFCNINLDQIPFGNIPPILVQDQNGQDHLVVNWYSPTAAPISINNQDPLMEICFSAKEDITDQEIKIEFGAEDFFRTQFAQNLNAPIAPCLQAGGINIEDRDVCTEEQLDSFIKIGVMDISCDTFENAPDAPMIEINCAQDQICFPVSGKNMDHLISLQTSMDWNNDQMSYAGIKPRAITFDYHPSNIATHNASAGNILLNWFNISGETILGSDEVLFEICFDIIGDMTDELWVRFSENEYFMTTLINEDKQIINVCAQDGGGNIQVPMMNCTDESMAQINVMHATVVCNSGSDHRFSISGVVNTENNEMIADVEIHLTKTNADEMVMTDEIGSYSFTDILADDYLLSPHKDGDYLNGLDALDLLLIQHHIIGIRPFYSPYKMIAADVNNSESITATDMLEIKKLILGETTELPNQQAWKFVDAHHRFAQSFKPWPYPDNTKISSDDQEISDMNFIAVKSGDVNGTADLNFKDSDLSKSSNQKILFKLVNDPVVPSKVAITLDQKMDIFGFQLQLNGLSDNQLVGIDPGVLSISKDDYHISENGSLRLINTLKAAISLNKGDVLFYLNYENTFGLPAIASSQRDLVSRVFDHKLQPIDIEIDNQTKAVFNSETSDTHRILPNPISDDAVFEFSMNEETEYVFEIFDQLGRVLFSHTAISSKGVNVLELRRELFMNQKAIFYYRMQHDGQSKTGKIVVAK